ncbi:cobalamin-5'-phosphate synthase [Primorskyibacter sedentarius]|uniref:Adenosylcobinamide-GDP ribazoletransferase n=1 Tax=Primorskyibacter sedentarius TaxID=745311 RepID=A0A4R3JLB2_9RHOB|nr:adenosylcobinamide-GDP ribazoletransferase [Primorskyibacter sedentarius]TCS67096.1 cobalamin-5'-phosphate synthase [Primorskyibacter sedentarius]
MSARRRIEEARLALMMLTRLPVGRLAEPAPSLGQASWAFPLVGLVIGLVGWAGFAAALSCGLPATLAGFLAVATTAWATGALHHDGLADFADGIGGGRDRAHCLEIMRDSRIGSYGAVALILAIGIHVTALSAGTAGIPLLAFLLLGVASRLVMLALLIWLPPARTDGLGRGATSQSAGAMVPGGVLVLLLAVLTGTDGMAALVAICVAAFVVAALARRRIGGQTGDVLGAAQMICEISGWIVWAAVAT